MQNVPLLATIQRALVIGAALLALSPAALADDPNTFRGKPQGAGWFAHGTITLNSKAIVVETRRVFREDTVGYKYKDIESFSTSIGVFRGRVLLNTTSGKVIELSAPPGAARAMKNALASRILSDG